jgi:GT2 family glycosyltransferase
VRRPIDVVIPVFNAPDLTRICIETLYRHCAEWLGNVHVYDDASDRATACMLDELRFPGLSVHHGERNVGFGEAVNRAIARTRTARVLVLNSDVAASDDFIAPLHAAMQADPGLAAVMPSGSTFAGYDLAQYALRAGCVTTYNLHGYAFLIQREAFTDVGGFDPAYGRGYFEDRDLSRKLAAKGLALGIHPQSILYHRVHGSFDDVPSFRDLLRRNRDVYLARHPGARRNALVVTGQEQIQDLGGAFDQELRTLLQEGGGAYWLTRAAPRSIPAFEVRFMRSGWSGMRRILRSHRHKAHHRITELWMSSGASRTVKLAMQRWAAFQRIPVRSTSA